MPAELRERFTRKQWKDCCGKGCKKCDIAQAYIGEYGKNEGLERLNDDRKAVRAGKAAPKARKKSDGKRRGGTKDASKKGGKAKKGKGDGKKVKAAAQS